MYNRYVLYVFRINSSDPCSEEEWRQRRFCHRGNSIHGGRPEGLSALGLALDAQAHLDIRKNFFTVKSY